MQAWARSLPKLLSRSLVPLKRVPHWCFLVSTLNFLCLSDLDTIPST
jgi:hypothetical protein